jgi:hypothetical protein
MRITIAATSGSHYAGASSTGPQYVGNADEVEYVDWITVPP